MTGVLAVLYKPKSILGLLVATGIVFIFIAGATLTINKDVHAFFLMWGSIFMAIGLIGWFFFVVPTIARNISR
jgi:FtsH-binding integral membrane protein